VDGSADEGVGPLLLLRVNVLDGWAELAAGEPLERTDASGEFSCRQPPLPIKPDKEIRARHFSLL